MSTASAIPLFGAVEAGGTKFVLAVATGTDPASIVERHVIPTTDPASTLAACVEFFRSHESLQAVGVGSFGPLDLAEGAGYGTFVNTPKVSWEGVSLHDGLAPLGLPMVIDTDVNAAALAEAVAIGADRLVYFTIGTGVGGGLVVDGKMVSGPDHPEMGHMSVERAPGDEFEGICPTHGACAEGLTSGPALEARFGVEKGDLASVIDQVVPLAAYYIAQLAVNAHVMIAPQRVVVGGGILQIDGIFDAIATAARERLGGYTVRSLSDDPWLTEPSLGTYSGVVGSLMLAEAALGQAAIV